MLNDDPESVGADVRQKRNGNDEERDDDEEGDEQPQAKRRKAAERAGGSLPVIRQLEFGPTIQREAMLAILMGQHPRAGKESATKWLVPDTAKHIYAYSKGYVIAAYQPHPVFSPIFLLSDQYSVTSVAIKAVLYYLVFGDVFICLGERTSNFSLVVVESNGRHHTPSQLPMSLWRLAGIFRKIQTGRSRRFGTNECFLLHTKTTLTLYRKITADREPSIANFEVSTCQVPTWLTNIAGVVNGKFVIEGVSKYARYYIADPSIVPFSAKAIEFVSERGELIENDYDTGLILNANIFTRRGKSHDANETLESDHFLVAHQKKHADENITTFVVVKYHIDDEHDHHDDDRNVEPIAGMYIKLYEDSIHAYAFSTESLDTTAYPVEHHVAPYIFRARHIHAKLIQVFDDVAVSVSRFDNRIETIWIVRNDDGSVVFSQTTFKNERNTGVKIFGIDHTIFTAAICNKRETPGLTQVIIVNVRNGIMLTRIECEDYIIPNLSLLI